MKRITRLSVIPSNNDDTTDESCKSDVSDDNKGLDGDEAIFASIMGVPVAVGLGVEEGIAVGLDSNVVVVVFVACGVVGIRTSSLFFVFVTSIIGREVGVSHFVGTLDIEYSVAVGSV